MASLLPVILLLLVLDVGFCWFVLWRSAKGLESTIRWRAFKLTLLLSHGGGAMIVALFSSFKGILVTYLVGESKTDNGITDNLSEFLSQIAIGWTVTSLVIALLVYDRVVKAVHRKYSK